jgi:hypothetical protein
MDAEAPPPGMAYRARAEDGPFPAGKPAPMGGLGTPNPGPGHLVGERGACGVGFLADREGRRRHDIIQRALHGLSCMEHRGACGGDRISGDGAGVMTSIPWELLEAEGQLHGHPHAQCGVAMAFLPQPEHEAAEAMSMLEAQCERQGLEVLGWRDVPHDKDILGPLAANELPTLRQLIVRHPTTTGDELEESLYRARRSAQGDILQAASAGQGTTIGDSYIASFSSRTIVYKGMVQSAVLGPFYKDLQNPMCARVAPLFCLLLTAARRPSHRPHPPFCSPPSDLLLCALKVFPNALPTTALHASLLYPVCTSPHAGTTPLSESRIYFTLL